MLKFVLNIIIAIYITSTIFMLYFWLNTFITMFKRDGKVFFMPIGYFLYIHFCPIIHTCLCFQIMKTIMQNEREEKQ